MQHTIFIHCADLHLGSRMEAHLSAFQAQNRRKELFQTFSRMTAYAEENHVQGILISGDLFDTSRVSPSAVSDFLHCVHEHPAIDFLYLPGNHDCCGPFLLPCDGEWPDNLWIFQSPTQYFTGPQSGTEACRHTILQKEYGSVTVTGLTGPADQLPALDPSRINLVMLHGYLESHELSDSSDGDRSFRYSLKDLAGKYIDYIAAGHIHQYRSGSIDKRGSYCYSGCLEGRGFDECGEKGFVLLDIIPDRHAHASVNFHFVPFAYRQLFDLSLDITGSVDYHDIEQHVQAVLEPIDSTHLVRLKLNGRISPELNPHPDWLLQKYADSFYFLHIEDCTRPILLYEDYRYDNSLKGEFIRLVLSDSDLTESDREKIIMEGLHVLSGEEIPLN